MATLFYISTSWGCGIRAARTLQSAEKNAREEVGRGNVKEVRFATEVDVAQVRYMGGRIPDGKVRRHSSHGG